MFARRRAKFQLQVLFAAVERRNCSSQCAAVDVSCSASGFRISGDRRRAQKIGTYSIGNSLLAGRPQMAIDRTSGKSSAKVTEFCNWHTQEIQKQPPVAKLLAIAGNSGDRPKMLRDDRQKIQPEQISELRSFALFCARIALFCARFAPPISLFRRHVDGAHSKADKESICSDYLC